MLTAYCPLLLSTCFASRAELGTVLLKAGQNGEVALIDDRTAVALNVARTGCLLVGRDEVTAALVEAIFMQVKSTSPTWPGCWRGGRTASSSATSNSWLTSEPACRRGWAGVAQKNCAD